MGVWRHSSPLTKVVDPNSLNPDPDTAFQVNRDPETDPFRSKITIYLSLGLHIGRPS
jgi:hypothetical protein